MSRPRRAAHSFLVATGAVIALLATAVVRAQQPGTAGMADNPAQHARTTSYHLVSTHTLGGEGGWDYLSLDTKGHRLFIARQDRVMVVDPARGTVLAEIPGLSGAHGVAFAYDAGHGFATSGRDSTVVMFDLNTLKVLGKTTAAPDDDAILFDPATKHIFTFNGDANSSSVIDATTGKRIGTIDLGAKPEFGVSDGHGKVYVNLESSSEVAEIDAAGMRVTRRWSIAPCQSPTGLAIDVVHHRLFSGCRNKVMAVSDASAGKLVTTVPIGAGVDACRFDAGTGNAFSSNGGDGTITVIHEDSPDRFTVMQTVQTMRGARTMELDAATHTLYTVSAKYGPAPTTSSPNTRRRRRPMVPGSFALLSLRN
jgi:YVTN family beta-propeller protein